jgi:hypothetical protein
MLLEQKLTTQIFRELFARSFVQVVLLYTLTCTHLAELKKLVRE